jgi:catechol 2,3-dioxygenase-like lactoylglutathione lyase family enzyme
MIPVKRLNHVVLYVRDAERAAAFCQEAGRRLSCPAESS